MAKKVDVKAQIEKAALKLIKSNKNITFSTFNSVGISNKSIEYHFGNITNLKKYLNNKYPDKFNIETSLNTRLQIENIVLEILKNKQRLSYESLEHYNISRKKVTHHFTNLSSLEKHIRNKYPDKFKDIPVKDLITKESKSNLSSTIKGNKRFIITTAVTGCMVDKNALASVKNYCKKNKAELLILVCSDPAHQHTQVGGYGTIDKILENENIITEDTHLNSNFFVSTIKTTAKQIDPSRGLGRLVKKGSLVLASPKQWLTPIPVSNTKMPRVVMTTGAITKPNYNSDMYMSARTAYLADNDHVMGGIIVEIENSKLFHYRQIQFDSKGKFADFGKLYSPDKVEKYEPEVIIPGDWHCGDVDPVVEKSIFEIIKKLKPRKAVLHDVFSGNSISHHERNSIIKRAIRAERGQLSLEDELKILAKDINKFTKVMQEVIIVKSNHDDFLARYLEDGCFIKEPNNLKLSLELARVMCDEEDPLKFGTHKYGINFPSKVKWLKIDEDFKVAGIQLGAHGHLGANGSKGTLVGMEKAYGKCVSAHRHTPGIVREAWCVGTCTYKELGYNKGASSWLHTLCLVYPNGMRQLINVIDGKYIL